MTAITEAPTALPRLALLIADEHRLTEIERILRGHYSSLMLVTDREKLREFQTPLIVITDSIDDVSRASDGSLAEGTQVLIISSEQDSETTSAGFEAGACDYLAYPFVAADVIDKTEKYLEVFRHSP